MATLPTDRTTSNTPTEHVADHNTLHGLWNKLTTKGDLLVATAAQAYSRLAVGTNGYVLTADSTQTEGVKWAAQSGSSVRLGSAQITSDVTSIGTGGSDIVTASAVTVASGHWIKITGFVGALYGASTNLQFTFAIKEGATQLTRAEVDLTSSMNQPGLVVWVGQPSAGSHTYKLTGQTNTGTANAAAGATAPAFILIEDLGT